MSLPENQASPLLRFGEFSPTSIVLLVPSVIWASLIDAALGRKEAAMEEGRRAIALVPMEKDVINGSRMIQYFATMADLCDRLIELRTNYSSFAELLNVQAWRGAGDLYERLLQDQDLRLN